VLAAEALERHARAFPRSDERLPIGGVHQWRRDGEHHQWNPETVATIQHAVRAGGTESYEQFTLSAEQLDDAVNYVKDGMTLDRTTYEGETIGVELPITVDLKVTDTEPGFAGDTQSGARKPATTETGLVVQVPIFVEEGDTIRIDTRTGEYQTRV